MKDAGIHGRHDGSTRRPAAQVVVTPTTHSRARDRAVPSTARATVRVTSVANVRKTYLPVKQECTDLVICTKNAHLDMMIDVDFVPAGEVVRRYLLNLLSTGRFNKKQLAAAIGSSRGHLDSLLKSGESPNLMSKHIDGIASALQSTPAAIWAELSGLAKGLTRAAAGAPQQRVDDEELTQGKRDRNSVSAVPLETAVSAEGDERHEPVLPSPRPRKTRDRSPRRPR